jgi:integrase
MKTLSAITVLKGRREGELLAFPSVRRMADILLQRCRDQSWTRTSVASLERFRTMTEYHNLEALLEQARADPAVAEQALLSFASALTPYTDSQVSALAMGAKIWFRLNGVDVSWQPLPGVVSPIALPSATHSGPERIILLALIGSGLSLAELLRLRIGDVGSLDSEGRLRADMEADPLAVQFIPRRGKQVERVTFLTYHTRQALRASLAERRAAGYPVDLAAPLIAQSDGSPASATSVLRARKRSKSLIRAGGDANIALCRTTGDFFRTWGLPGSRFVGAEDFPIEEFM